MDNINNIIGIAQWSISFLIVAGFFLLGFKRGTKKSLYYTVNSVLLTFILLFLLSFVSIRVIFRTPGALLSFIDKIYLMPDNIREYLINPDLSPYVFAIIDLVLRFVALLVLYPIFKFLITYFVSRPIWKKITSKRQRRQPEPKKVKVVSRFGGGFLGIFRGVLTVFILFLPFIVFSGAVNKFEGSSKQEEDINLFSKLLDTTADEDEVVNDDPLFNVIKSLQDFNTNGIGSIVKNIKVGEKSIDESMFDFIFTVKAVKPNGEKEKIAFSKEFNLIGEVAQILITEGYLDSTFDIKTVNHEDNYEHINKILNNLGDSELVNLLLPVLIDIANDEGLLEEALGFNVENNQYTKSSFKNLKSLSWRDEMATFSKIVEELLLIDNVGGLMDLSSNPKDIFKLDLEAKQRFTKVLNNVSSLDILSGLNIALEYVLQDEALLSKITWSDNPYEYIHEKLDFVFSNSNYFKGDDGVISHLANLVTIVFSEEHQDYDFDKLLSGKISADILLEDETSALVTDVITGLTSVDFLMKVIPLGIDFAVYSNDITSGEIADVISETASNTDFTDELNHVNDIYSKILTLGLGAYFEDGVDVLAVTDYILSDETLFNSVKSIVKVIFEDSKFINDVIEIVAEPLVQTMISDSPVKDLVLSVITTEDFKFGKEVSNALTLLEYVYKFTNLSTVMNSVKNEEYLQLVSSLADLNEEDFTGLKDTLFNLQTIKSNSVELVTLVQEMINVQLLVIPANISYTSVVNDLTRIFDLVYSVATEVKKQDTNNVNLNDINLLELINKNEVYEILAFDNVKDENSILLHSIVELLRKAEITLTGIGVVSLPDAFYAATPSSDLWMNELNDILLGMLNVVDALNLEDDDFKLTMNNLSNITGLDSLPASLITRFEDKELLDDTFSGLLNSNIIHHNIIAIGKQIANNTNIVNKLNIFNDTYGLDHFSGDAIIDLLGIVVDLFTKVKMPGNTIQSAISGISLPSLIDSLSDLERDFVRTIGQNKTLNTIFRNTLLESGLIDVINDLLDESQLPQELNGIVDVAFNFDKSLDSNSRIPENTLEELLVFVHRLNVPSNINNMNIQEIIEFAVSEKNVEGLLNIKVVNELLANALTSDQVHEMGIIYFYQAMNMAQQNGFDIMPNYETYYNDLISSLLNNEQLIDVNEFKLYANIYTLVNKDVLRNENINLKDLTLVAETLFNSKVSNKNVYELISESKLIRKVLNTVLNDESILELLVDKINQLPVLNNPGFNVEDIKVGSRFSDSQGIKKEHLLELLLAVASQDLSIVNRGSFDITDINNLLNTPNNSYISRLEAFYNSELLTGLLEQVITNDKTNAVLVTIINDQINQLGNNLGINPVGLNANDLNLTWDLFDYNAALSLVNFINELDVNSFKELANIKSIDQVSRLLNVRESKEVVENFVNIPLVYYVFEKVASTKVLPSIVTGLINEKVIKANNLNIDEIDPSLIGIKPEFVNKEEFVNLILAVFGANVDFNSDFTNPQILRQLTVDVKIGGTFRPAIEQVLNSNIIFSMIDGTLRSKELFTSIANFVNNELRKDNIDLTLVAEDLMIPLVALDSNGKLYKSDFTQLLNVVNSLNLQSYNELTSINSLNKLKDVVDLNVYNELFEVSFLHHFISNLLTNEKILGAVADYANRALRTNKIDFTINKELISVPADLLDNKNRIPVSEFMVIFEAVYMLDIENFNNIKVTGTNDIKNIVPFSVFEKLLQSNILYRSINKIVQSAELRTTLANTLNKQFANVGLVFVENDFIIDSKVLDANNRILRSDLLSIIEALYLVNIENFNNIELSMESINQMVPLAFFEKALDANIVHYIIDELVQNDKVKATIARVLNSQSFMNNVELTFRGSDFNLAEDALDVNGMLAKDDILNIVEVLLSVNIDNFNNIKVNNPSDVENIISLELISKLLSTNVIHKTLNKVIQSQRVREVLASTINTQLARRELNVTINQEAFVIPERLLDNGVIKLDDILLLVETFYGLNIDNFNNIKINGIEDVKNILPLETIETLLNNGLVHFGLDKVLQSKVLRTVLANEVNKLIAGRVNVLLTANDFEVPFDALDVNNMIEKTDLISLVRVVYGLNITNFNQISLNSPSDIENIAPLQTIKDVLNIKFVFETLNKVVLSERGRTVTAEVLTSLLNNNGFNVTISADAFVLPTRLLVNGKINKNDILLVAESFYSLNISNFNNIKVSGLEDIRNIVTQDTINDLINNNTVFFVLDKLVQSNAVRAILAEQVNKLLQQQNISQTLSADDLVLHSNSLDNLGMIFKDDLKTLVDVVYNLNIDKFNEIDASGVPAIEEIINENTLVRLLSTKLIHGITDKLVQSEVVRETLASIINTQLARRGLNVTISADTFKVPEHLLVNGMINLNDIYLLVETFYSLNIPKFNAIKVDGMDSIRLIIAQVTLNNVFENDTVHFMLDKLVQSNAVRTVLADQVNKLLAKQNLSQTLSADDLLLSSNSLDNSGMIFKDDLKTLVDIVYNLNIDKFNKIDVSGIPAIEHIINEDTLVRLLSTKLVHGITDKLVQSEVVREALASLINNQLTKLGLNEKISAEAFKVPEHLLVNGMVNINDIQLMVETIYSLNIPKFNAIKVDGMNSIRDIITQDTLNNLFDNNTVHFMIDKLVQSNAVRTVLADQVNKLLQQQNISQTLRPEHLILPAAALDANGMIEKLDIRSLIDVVYNLNIDKFSKIDVSGIPAIEHIINQAAMNQILETKLVHGLTSNVVLSETFRNALANIINTQLARRGLKVTINPEAFVIPAHLLVNGMVNVNDMKLLVETIYSLNIPKFNAIKVTNPSDIESIIELEQLKKLINNDMIHFTINKLFNNKVVKTFIANTINSELAKRNINLNLQAQHLDLPISALDKNGLVEKNDMIQFLEVFFDLGISNFNSITVKNTKDIENIISLDTFDKLINIKFIYETMNSLVQNDKVKTKLAEIVSKQLKNRNIDINIQASHFDLPKTLLLNGKLNTSEIAYLLQIAYELDFESFKELSRIRTASQIKEIVSLEMIDMMLESEIIYYFIGFVPQSEAFRVEVAKFISQELNKRFGITQNINATNLLFEKYGALESTGKYEGYIKKDEFRTIASALYKVDFSTIMNGNIYDKLNNTLNQLLLKDTNEQSLLDELLSSNIFYGTIERIINVSSNAEIENMILNEINKIISKTSLNSLQLETNDKIFEYHANALDTQGFVTKDEIYSIFESIKTLNISNRFSINIITYSIDRNIDADGKDDFSRIYKSLVLRSVISNLAKSDKLMDMLANTVNKLQKQVEISKEMVRLPEKIFEEGLIIESEFRHLLNAVNLLGINSTDVSDLGISSILDLMDNNIDLDGKDDFDRIFDSIIIHSFFDRVIQSDSIEKLVASIASDIFKQDIKDVNTKPNNDQLDDHGMFSKLEIRKLFISIKLLGINDMNDLEDVSLSIIMDLINSDNDINTFLDSNYIRVMISRLLLSRTVKTKLAEAANFDVELLTLNSLYYDQNNDMTSEEITNLFVAMNTLGINDFTNIQLDNAVLKALSEDNLNTVLESNYLYQVLSLTLNKQLAEYITNVALVDDGTHQGYVKKTEIKALIDSLAILGIDNANDISSENITIRQIQELNKLNSSIVRNLISKQLEEQIEIPAESMEDGIIKTEELDNVLKMLTIIANNNLDTSLSELNMTNISITTLQFNEIINIGESPIIIRLVSEQIIKLFENINVEAFKPGSTKDIKFSELDKLNTAIMSGYINFVDNELTGGININDIEVVDLEALLRLESLIIHREMSREITKAIDVPSKSYMANGIDINYDEIQNVFTALTTLGITKLSTLDDGDLSISYIQFSSLLNQTFEDSYSPIITRLLSENVIKALGDNFNKDALEEINGYDIKRSELVHLSNALFVLKVTNVADGINIDTTSISDIIEIVEYKSLIIDRLISIEIANTGIVIPKESMLNDKDLHNIEIFNLFVALQFLSIDDIGSLDLDELNLTVESYGKLLTLEFSEGVSSYLISRLISDEIKKTNMDIPAESTTANGDIANVELNNLYEALVIMGIDNLKDLDIDNLNLSTEAFNDMIQLEFSEGIPSYLITRLISTEIRNTGMDIPVESTAVNGDIANVELNNLYEALVIMGIDNLKELEIDNLNLSTAAFNLMIQLEFSDGIPSYLITRLISNEIRKTGMDIPVESTTANGDIANVELNNLYEALVELKILELNKLDTNNLNISTEAFGKMLYFEFEEGVPSYLITRLISENTINALNLDDNPDALESNGKDIKRQELIYLYETLDKLGITTINNDLNIVNTNLLTIKEVKELQSIIVDRLISIEVINSGRLIKPSNVYVDGSSKDIKHQELINLFDSANSIPDVDTIAKLIAYFETPNPYEMLLVYNSNKDKPEEEKSQILIATFMDVLGLN